MELYDESSKKFLGKEAAVERAVSSGLFPTRARAEAAWDEMERELNLGLDDLEAGRTVSLEEAFEHVTRTIEEVERAKRAA